MTTMVITNTAAIASLKLVDLKLHNSIKCFNSFKIIYCKLFLEVKIMCILYFILFKHTGIFSANFQLNFDKADINSSFRNMTNFSKNFSTKH